MNEIFNSSAPFNGQIDSILSSILKYADVIISILDSEGRYLYVNHQVAGYKKEEIIGKPVFDFLPENHSLQLRNNLLKVIHSGKSTTYQNEFVEQGGGSRYYTHVMSPVKTNDRDVQAVIVITTEITEAIPAKENAQPQNSNISEKERREEAFIKSEEKLAVRADAIEIQKLILEKERREKVLHDLINATSGKRGMEYFEALVMSLGSIVHADKVFIGRLHNNKQSIHTIAHYDHGKIEANFNYDLKGTPCQDTLNKTTCFYESRVADLFPDDKELRELKIEAYLGTAIYNKNNILIGIVVALFHEPLQEGAYLRSLFELLSTSVGTEMERLDAETALKESEQKYKFLAESAHELVCMHSPDGRYIHVSPSSKKLLGYKSDELIGIDPCSLIHPDDVDRIIKSSHNKVLKGKAVRDIIYRISKKDGTYIWFDTYAEAIKSADGSVKYLISHSRDITDIRNFQEALISKQQELKVALAHNTAITDALNNSALVSITDVEGKIVHANEIFCRVSGYSLEEILGNNHRMINSGHHPKSFWRHMWKTISKGITWRAEVCNLAKDGSIYWVDTVINPIKNERGKVYQYMSVRNLITERKLSEKALLKAHDLLEKTNEAASIGTWEVDLETMKCTLSKVTKEIYEVDEDFHPTVERGIAYYKEGISRNTITQVFNACVANGEKFDVEVQLVTAKRNEKWVRVIGIPVMENGKCIQVYGLFQNIDEKTKAIKQLAFQEELFRKTLENAPNGIAMVNREGNWFKMNKSFCDILGYSEEELKVLSFLDITHPGEKKNDGVLFKEMVAGKQESFQTEKRYIHKNGSTVWATLSVAAVKNDLGRTIHFIYQINDITQKKLSQLQLQEHMNRLQGILDASTQVGIMETDAKGIIKVFNKGAENLLGYTAKEVVDKVTPGIFHDKEEIKKRFKAFPDKFNDNTEEDELAKNVLLQGLFQTREWTYLRKDGSPLSVLLSLTPLHNGNNKISGSLGIITDLTEIKRAEREIKALLDVAQAQNKRLLNFAHIISHNLRSHTANLSMILDLMQTENSNTTDNYYFPLLEESSNNLKETISHLNEVVVMNTITKENLTNLHLFEYVEKSITNVQALALKAGCTIYSDVQKNIKVQAIPAYLESIILNIVTNAIKYKSTKRKPVVNITSELQNNFVLLRVKDNGLGIDLKLHGAKLFGMYKTFHGNEDARGIGLFITKNQVEAIGGKIEVESKIERGTTFTLYLQHEKI